MSRLAKDLRHLDLRHYEHAAGELDEVGRLVGGCAICRAEREAVRQIWANGRFVVNSRSTISSIRRNRGALRY